jgi:hypothetical protein
MWRDVCATKAQDIEGTVIWSHQSLSKAIAGVFGWHLVGHLVLHCLRRLINGQTAKRRPWWISTLRTGSPFPPSNGYTLGYVV